MVTLEGKDADEFVRKMIENENREPTEKEKQMKKDLEEFEFAIHKDRVFLCEKCGRRLLGMEEINKHKDENWDHFTYECMGSNAVLCFA